MRRRNLLIGAGAGVAGLAGVGFAASETGLLLNEPDETIGTVIEPGVLEYGTHGIGTLGWYKGEDNRVNLKITYESTPPDSFRLHQPDGKKIWSDLGIEAKSDYVAFGLPIRKHGTWELVAEQSNDHISLQFPVRSGFKAENFGLRGDDVAVDISNPTNTPAYIKGISISALNRYSDSWGVTKRLMPGETYHFETKYTLNHYKEVRLYVDSDSETGGELAKKDFV